MKTLRFQAQSTVGGGLSAAAALLLLITAGFMRTSFAEPTGTDSGASSTSNTSRDTITRADYESLLNESLGVFEKPKGDGAQTRARNARQIADILEQVQTVTLPDGSRVSVDTGEEVQAINRQATRVEQRTATEIDLEDEEKDSDTDPTKFVKTKSGKLFKTKKDKDQDDPPIPPTQRSDYARISEIDSLVAPGEFSNSLSEDPRKVAKSVLAVSEFQYKPDEKPQPNWLQRQLENFGRWLDRLFNNQKPPDAKPIGGLETLAAVVKFILIGLAIVAATAGIGYLVLYFYRNKTFNGVLHRRANDGALDATEAELLDPLSAARSLAAAGDFRGAIRLTYIASLKKLAESGLLALQKNKTNGEYLRALRKRSRPAWELLLPATHLFDRVWYGRQPATRSEYDQTVGVYESLSAAIASTRDEETPATSGTGDRTGDRMGDRTGDRT